MGEGYKPKRRELPLRFAEDSELAGLVIVAESLRYKECQKYYKDGYILDEDFIARIKSWNLSDPDTEDDEILPITVESLGVLDTPDVAKIKTAWLNKCAGRPDSFLEKELSDGDMSGVESLPMESL